MSYYLPVETARAIEKYVRMCKNLGLILDKYPTKLSLEKPTKEDKQKGKTPWLLSLLEPEKPEGKTSNNHIDVQLAQNVYNRWFDMILAVEAQPFKQELDWRMVVGLGGETVLETDLTLHRLYGIPYVPGSALKGLTRAYAVGEEKKYYVPEDKPENERIPSVDIDNDHPDIKRIFGTQKDSGTVIFFDAMPLDGKAEFTLDIMNPHYPDYYSSLQSSQPLAPTNDQNPNPVTFLTVTNTTFVFALAPRNPKDEQHKLDVQQACELLQKALQKYGIGGKTSAGYGYFRKPESIKPIALSQDIQTESAPIPLQARNISQQKTDQTERIRTIIRRPTVGQVIQGTVIESTEYLRQYTSQGGQNVFLRYEEYNQRDIFMVIGTEYTEAQNWKVRETRHCEVLRIEEHDKFVVIVCKPKQGKNKDKQKKS